MESGARQAPKQEPCGIPRILGVNGIRSDGSQNTDRLLAELARLGHATVDFHYGRVGFFRARSVARQKAIGHRLREVSQVGDHVVAHSYGCLVTLRAMQSGARFGSLFLFAPAMDDDYTFPWHAAQRIFVIHCRTDLALVGGTLLPGHSFGRMGRTGYRGPYDARVTNIAVEPRFLAHSRYFAGRELGHWGQFISSRLNLPTVGAGVPPVSTVGAGVPPASTVPEGVPPAEAHPNP